MIYSHDLLVVRDSYSEHVTYKDEAHVVSAIVVTLKKTVFMNISVCIYPT